MMNIKSKLRLLLICLAAEMISAPTAEAQNVSTYAENYELMTDDGAWCWFSDPRAVYAGNRIIGGYVDKEGSIWSFSYDITTREKQYFKLYDKLDYDDHANPSFLKLADGRIVSFFSAHGGAKRTPLFYRITRRAADITEWEPLQEVRPDIPGRSGFCYTNAALLSAENKTYLFFRGPNFKPCFVTTEDFKTWSEPVTLVQDDPGARVRPYMKVANNGKDKIFFAFTDDHPRNNPINSIYYAHYRNGKYYKADGTEIAATDAAKLTPKDCDKVYDAAKTMEKAWIWDVAYDKDENPVIVYARFSHAMPEHSYWYARWDGREWTNHKITKAGHWFQRDKYSKTKMEYECNYSGGVYLDHENPDIVYTSRPIGKNFEIERWTTQDGGAHWKSESVTRNSDKDNVRPFVVRGYKEGQPSVLWMYNYQYPGFRAYHTGIRLNRKAEPFSDELIKKDIMNVARATADWQIGAFSSNPYAKASKGWIAASLYVGMFDWAELSGEDKYMKWLNRMGNRHGWQLADRMYHADDVCVAQTYLDMYARFKREAMMIPTKLRLDWVIENPSSGSLDLDNGVASTHERWSWCDALFMAPPVYVRMYMLTGDKKYMKFADKEFKATYDRLYDKEERLFYRDSRYMAKKEKNGKKVFWGRGNGWVMGGLAEILKTLPEKERKYRPFYERLFKEMASRLLELQSPDGFWRASLLNPESYPAPETSATGFITYALAYGVNEGLLPAGEYLPAIKKGWTALVSAVRADGKLGWVQPVGAHPNKVKENMTEFYGVGSFLMTACEVYKLADK